MAQNDAYVGYELQIKVLMSSFGLKTSLINQGQDLLQTCSILTQMPITRTRLTAYIYIF